MKLYFSLIFLVFLTKPLLSNDFETRYQIKTKGIGMGFLTWKLVMKDGHYETSLELESKGFLSMLYNFEGRYSSSGKVIDNFLIPNEYNQFWKTKKKEKVVKILFKNKKISYLSLIPLEKNIPRINYKDLNNYVDPLTSFINILFNQKPSYTIDGRRSYLLIPNKIDTYTKILISEYKNIWADHKRNDLEYLEIFKEKNQILPKKINIMFKGSIFSLKKI